MAREIEETYRPKVTGTDMQPDDIPVTDQMSPWCKWIVNGLVIVIIAAIAALLIANGLQ